MRPWNLALAVVTLCAVLPCGGTPEKQRVQAVAAVAAAADNLAQAGRQTPADRPQRDTAVTNPKRSVPSAAQASGPRPSKPRIEPVKKADWTDAQREILEPFERANRLHNVFTTMANHPDLARDWLTFATHVLRRNSLPPRDREILILRIGWLCKAEYEWAQHVRIGKTDGLSDDCIKRITEGPESPGLADHDRLLLQAVDELRTDACLTDATWTALAKTYNDRQLMDLVFTVGQYNLVSMALNSFGVQLDEGLEGFPEKK